MAAETLVDVPAPAARKPDPTTTEPSGPERARPDRTRYVASGLALAAAIAVVVVNRQLFPLYSLNRDDSVYVAMARVIERGHLTLPELHWPFRPWATGSVDDRLAFKYAPPWPAVLAVADELGSLRLALAATAAGTVFSVRAFAIEILDDAVTATVSAALLVLSPVFLVQGSTYLPYLFSLMVACGAGALLLRGAREGSRTRLAVAGALIGVLVFARPFDAVLLAVPIIVVGLWSCRPPMRARSATWIAVGLAPVLALDLVHNWLVLGSPFTLPFGVTGSADAFGFGPRGVFESSTVPFDFVDGLSGAGTNLRWLPSWTFGGPVLLALAVWGLIDLARTSHRRGHWLLVAWAVVLPVAYIFFWGPWAMADNWDGVQTFGPYYHLPLVVPVVVFGAHGLRVLARRPTAAVAACVAMLAFTAWSVPDKIDANERGTDQYRAAQQAVDAADLHDAILFLPWRGDSGFLGITPFLEYDPGLDADVLYAQDCGTAQNQTLLDEFAPRAGYRLEVVDDDHLDDPDAYVVRSTASDPAGRDLGCER